MKRTSSELHRGRDSIVKGNQSGNQNVFLNILGALEGIVFPVAVVFP